MHQILVTIIALIFLASCVSNKDKTVGDVLSAMPKNDNQYQVVMHKAGLQTLRLGQPHVEVIEILSSAGQNYITGNNWIVMQPIDSNGSPLAKELSIKLNDNQKVEFMILDVGRGLRFVVN